MDAPFCQGSRDHDARIAELEARVAALETQLQEQARILVDLAHKLQDNDLPTAPVPSPAPIAYRTLGNPSPGSCR
jgi:hypothetical protein